MVEPASFAILWKTQPATKNGGKCHWRSEHVLKQVEADVAHKTRRSVMSEGGSLVLSVATTSTMVSFQQLCVVAVCGLVGVSHAFVAPSSSSMKTTQLRMGLFDKWSAGGSGNSKEALDEQWEAQQEILRNRRKPKSERDEYFKQIEKRREEASEKQQQMWSWQTKKYGKGEDPIDEWRKRRASGDISDLDDQYGDPKEVGGIPLPIPSFGVGGEFGLGGKYDNGGRFVSRIDDEFVDMDSSCKTTNISISKYRT